MMNLFTVSSIGGSVIAGAGFVASLLAFKVFGKRPTKREREIRTIIAMVDEIRESEAHRQPPLPLEETQQHAMTAGR